MFVGIHNPKKFPRYPTKEDILKYLGRLYEQNLSGRVDRDKIAEALIDRERLVTTGVGYGLAFPNAKVDGLNGTHMGIYRLPQEMDWQAMDKRPVDLIIPIIASNDSMGAHLNVMAGISYILKNDTNRERLREAIDIESGHIDRRTIEAILDSTHLPT